MKSSEGSKAVIKTKEDSMCRQAHEPTQRESPWVTPLWQFELLLWSISSGFHLAILICLVHSPYLIYLRSRPCVRTLLLVKMEPTAKASGLTLLPLWPARNLFCACVFGVVSWTRNMWFWQGPNSSLNCPAILDSVSVNREWLSNYFTLGGGGGGGWGERASTSCLTPTHSFGNNFSKSQGFFLFPSFAFLF